ncbi:hypothetical protein KAI58_03170 [Candidatus Gracilibacteria bacterium]|nr:hypothetical protein [Candidatus Gracilibacteria bacterium]
MKNEIHETNVEVVAEPCNLQEDKDSTNSDQDLFAIINIAIEKVGIDEVRKLVKKYVEN